ncbi:MAG: CamS family sex pheromone protein [Bacilli bacterium]
MKKYIYIIIFLLLITGCGKKISQKTSLGTNYYNVATPYKKAASNNYIVNNMNSYDIDEVESSLMEISNLYFYSDTSYYQDGQYLTTDFLKKVLSKEYLNNYESFEIDGVKINPYYITGISEQNYLDIDGNLKGISLGIILNPYQSYKNKYGITLYKEVEESKIIKIGEDITNKLLLEVRKIQQLKKSKILVALYIQGSPLNNNNGSYKKYGITANNKVNFKNNMQFEYYITSDYVMKNNNDIYSSFISLEKELKQNIPKLYLIGNCNYKNSELKNITLTITASSLSKSEILISSQIVSDNILKNNLNNIIIYIKENNNIKAIIDKKRNEKTNIHILEGI